MAPVSPSINTADFARVAKIVLSVGAAVTEAAKATAKPTMAAVIAHGAKRLFPKPGMAPLHLKSDAPATIKSRRADSQRDTHRTPSLPRRRCANRLAETAGLRARGIRGQAAYGHGAYAVGGQLVGPCVVDDGQRDVL